MKRSTKLVLDILMGAVVPIMILNLLTRPLGAPPAYVLAALVPVAWVLGDLLFVTRQFNVITSYVGATAIVNGALAFWFVDGVLFALKDSAGLIFTALVLAASILVGRPLMKYFFMQGVGADTPSRRSALEEVLREPPILRALLLGTLIVTLLNALASGANFLLNLSIVTARFGTEAFNSQVAQVNAITRVALPLASLVAFGAAFWLVYRAVFQHLPAEEGKDQLESDFWRLMELREQQRGSVGG